jgi:hypothetical protein
MSTHKAAHAATRSRPGTGRHDREDRVARAARLLTGWILTQDPPAITGQLGRIALARLTAWCKRPGPRNTATIAVALYELICEVAMFEQLVRVMGTMLLERGAGRDTAP